MLCQPCGMPSAAFANESELISRSRRVSQGSNESIPVTLSYTLSATNSDRGGGSREIPLGCVETEPLVNHHSAVKVMGVFAVEDDLAAVRVTCPFVKNQHSKKIPVILDSIKRQEVKEVAIALVYRQSGAEGPSTLAWRGAPRSFDDHTWAKINQLLINIYDLTRRHRKSQARSQPRSEQFVKQYFGPLKIVHELHYIVVIVRTFHELRLGPSAHSSYMLNRVKSVWAERNPTVSMLRRFSRVFVFHCGAMLEVFHGYPPLVRDICKARIFERCTIPYTQPSVYK